MKQSLCFEPCWARFPMISFFYIHRRLTKNAIKFNLKTFKVSQSKVIFRRYFFLVSKEIITCPTCITVLQPPFFQIFKKQCFLKVTYTLCCLPKIVLSNFKFPITTCFDINSQICFPISPEERIWYKIVGIERTETEGWEIYTGQSQQERPLELLAQAR